MQELRIVLTVLPVGPRGEASLVAGQERWFALQIAAGFAETPAPGELDGLWPWVLQVEQAGKIDLQAWLIDGTGAAGPPTDLQAEGLGVDDFGRKLRETIQAAYTAEERAGLDLRWLLPQEAAGDPEHQRKSFPARAQYLATLPGELSRRLLATVHVRIPVDALFTAGAGGLQPRGKTLWIAPKGLGRPEPTPADLAARRTVALNGPPAVSALDPGLFDLSGLDQGLALRAIGPGFALSRLLQPEPSPVFDLATYRMRVGAGNHRFAEVESLLLDALDPFGEISHLSSAQIRRVISFQGATPRPLPAEAADALLDLWRAQAMVSEISRSVPAGVTRLARHLLSPGAALPPLAAVPDRWRIDAGPNTLTAQIDRLAAVLGISTDSPRDRLRQMAGRAGFAAVAAWLAQAFDAVLTASDPAAVANLIDRWSFKGVDLKESGPQGVAERRLALAQVVTGELREEGDARPLLADLAGAGANAKALDHLQTAARERLKQRWLSGGRLSAGLSTALSELGLAGPGETPLLLATGAEVELANAHLTQVWPAQETPERTELPGRGLALVLGDDAHRLVHEGNPALAGDGNGLYGEIAGVALRVRRGKDGNDLAGQSWRLVTGGAALIGDLGNRLFAPGAVGDDEWLRELLPVPLRPTFQQGVARADVEYHGQPMLAQSPLVHAYAAGDYAVSDPGGPSAAYSFQALGGFAAVTPEAAEASRAPVLRYGDQYEFRASLVDQAGGLPTGIARQDQPWRLDLAAATHPEQVDPGAVIRYPRRVPVGELNLLPTGDWPALPGDVSLRSREWWALAHPGADNIPVLLLSGEMGGKPRFPGTVVGYEAGILPPGLDEHTLLRWAAPALDDPNAATARQKLLNALTVLYEARQKPSDGDEARAIPLHDPAVTALGVRVTLGDAANGLSTIHEASSLNLVDDPGKPFARQPVVLKAAGAASNVAPAVTAGGGRIDVTVPEGTFVAIEIWPLVPRADFVSRFAAAEVFADLVDGQAPFPDHVAFRPSVLLAEAVTDRMPKPADLYAGLTLEEQNGAVAIDFKGQPDNLAFVDRFILPRQRWVWRNRPLVTPAMLSGETDPGERRRRAASGPPKEVLDPGTRDDPAGPVALWEGIAKIDRGFVDRGDLTGRWPRKATSDPAHAGGTAGDVLLARDDRDGITAADYLRYGLRARSRYAGVLPRDQREVTAEGAQTWRRIALGFRGQKIKPPKILGVVPLTRPLAPDPLGAATDATPFLVLLDETFFREYGIGERLEARLTLENLDIGEDPKTAELPYRTGPLPDHWLPASPPAYFRGKQVTPGEDAGAPILLDVFGPFGYSLDVSPAEALANASAFVVYPPEDVHPQWAMFARFRRVLDRPSNPKGQTSDLSDAYALYTLPDSGLLARAGADVSEPALERTGPASFALRGLDLLLDPLARAGGAGGPARNSAVASRYRYFLLISRVVRGAGQALDVELPAGLWRAPLFAAAGGFQAPGSFAVELRSGSALAVQALNGQQELAAGGEYRGRILEVLLNGQYDGESRLDGLLAWNDFWKGLFDDAADPGDAAGMIRRVSEAFVVRG